MLRKLLKVFNIKKIFFLIILLTTFQNLSLSEDIKNFQIELMSIEDSALNYFSETELEDNEQGWHNYSYKEYSTSFMPGKGIYSWFLVSYRSDDYNFKIEALVGGIVKKNYNNKKSMEYDICPSNCLNLFEFKFGISSLSLIIIKSSSLASITPFIMWS